MQITNFAQPNPGVQVTAATNTAVNGNTEQLSNSVAPTSDRLSITSDRITLARQVVTQQVEIALELKSPVAHSKHAAGDDDRVDQLVNKVVQKIHDEKAAKADDDSDDHHSAAVSSVRVKVARGFENAVAALSRSGNVDGPVANDVEQVRSRVYAAIDNVAGQPVSVPPAAGGADAPAANVETTRLDMVSAQRDMSSSLQLTTRDGDVVTVNLSRSQALTAGSITGPEGSLLYAGAASSSLIDISVQGNLSEKENESIRKVVESINKLAEKMFSGDTGAAMEKLGELKINTEYLAGMSLSMSSSISYQAVSAYSQVSRLPDESVSAAPSTPSAVNAGNSVAASGGAPVLDQSAAPVVDAAGANAVPVVAEAAAVVNDAVASDAFEDPFDSVRNLFAQIADMFSSLRGDVSDEHKDFVSELFKGIVDRSEDEQGYDKKLDQDDGVAVNDLAA